MYYNLQLRSSGGDEFECRAIDVAVKPWRSGVIPWVGDLSASDGGGDERDMCSSGLDTLMHGAAAAALEGKDDDDDDAEEFICSTSDWWIYWSGLWRVFLYDTHTHTHTHAKSERRRIYTGRVSNAQRYDITVACVYIIPPNNNIIIFDTISPSAKYNISRVSYTHLCYIMLHVVAIVKCLDNDVIYVSIDSFSPIYSRT